MVLDVNCVTIIFTCSRPVLSGSLTWFGSFASERGLRSPTGPVPDEHLRLYIWSLSLKAPEIGTVNIQLFEHVLNVRIHLPDLLTWLLVCRLVVPQYQRGLNLVKSILCGLGLSSLSSIMTLASPLFHQQETFKSSESSSLTFNHIGRFSDLVMTQL